MKKKKVNDPLNNYIFDTFFFASFQLPIYIVNMLFADATFFELIKAALTITLLFVFLGRPYGIYLDYLKKLFR